MCIRDSFPPEATWAGNPRFAGQEPPEAALAADMTSVVLAAKKAATLAATCDISISSTPPPQGVVDFIEMSNVAADVAAFLAAATTDVLPAATTDLLAADTTDVLSAAKAAPDFFCLARPGDDECKPLARGQRFSFKNHMIQAGEPQSW